METHPTAESEAHPHAAVHVLRTWLRAEGSIGVLRTHAGSALHVAATEFAAPPCWPVDALLLGAVEAGVRAEFVHRAERAGLELAFYESTAQARWSQGASGPEWLDLCVQPRVGVHRAADVEKARALFEEVSTSCLAARALRTPLILHPTVELWTARPGTPGGSVRP